MNTPRLVRLSDVRPVAVTWLWPGYLPCGKLALLDGDPGLGKSLIAIDLAARLSRGGPVPEGAGGGTVRRTLFLQSEDGKYDTLPQRLIAAGADLTQIMMLEHDGPSRTILPRDLPALEQLIVAEGVGLLVIDPLIAFLSRRAAAENNQAVRRVLGRLAGIAERTGAAVLMVRHLTKYAGQPALYRGGGSIGIIGSARSALLACRDPNAIGRYVLTASKGNLGPPSPAVGYQIVAPDGVATIKWLGAMALTADEALNPPEGAKPGLYQAVEFLLAALKSGPRPATEVVREATAAGISERTLERAKKEAKVVSELKYEGKERQWIWKVYKPLFPPLPEMW